MTNISGRVMAVTETGEAPVTVNLRQEPDGLRMSESGTVTVSDMNTWQEISRTWQVRLRLPDGREGEFAVPGGAGSPVLPVTLRIERADGETF